MRFVRVVEVKKTLILCLVALAGAALGTGHDAGNGGHAVVCSDTSGKLASVQFFDLWYAQKEMQASLLESAKNEKELAREVVTRLYQLDGRFSGLLESFAYVSQTQVQLGQELKLIPPSTFLGNVLPATDSGCVIQPLAVFSDGGVLLTDGKIWDFLHQAGNPVARNVHAAAFLVHESIGDMFRRQALGRLTGGTTLDEETRKRIARDTVNSVAIAFSKQSDKRLEHRLEKYFTEGIVFERARVERIATSPPLPGGETCEQWKTKEEARLGPLSEIAIVECSGGSPHITAVPKRPVMTFTEAIHSDLVDASAGALSSWQEKASAWRLEMEKRFGSGIYLHHEGHALSDSLYRMWRCVYWWGTSPPESFGSYGHWETDYMSADRCYARGFDEKADRRDLGIIDTSVGEIYLYVDAPDVRSEEHLIQGEQESFDVQDEPGEREATRKALVSYDTACTAWKEEKYRQGAIFAGCAAEAPKYEVDTVSFNARYSSTGKAFFNDD